MITGGWENLCWIFPRLIMGEMQWKLFGKWPPTATASPIGHQLLENYMAWGFASLLISLNVLSICKSDLVSVPSFLCPPTEQQGDLYRTHVLTLLSLLCWLQSPALWPHQFLFLGKSYLLWASDLYLLGMTLKFPSIQRFPHCGKMVDCSLVQVLYLKVGKWSTSFFLFFDTCSPIKTNTQSNF